MKSLSRFFSRASSIARVGAVAMVAILAIASCGGDAADGRTGADDAGSRAESVATEATGELVVYSYDAFPEALETLVVDHFRSEFSVAASVERFQDTGDLYNQTWLERDDPQGDVVIGLDTTYVGRALEAELFQAYEPAGAERLRSSVLVDSEFRLTPFDWGHIVLNYDSEALANPPSTWDDLLDPSLRESIILMNPATSSPGRNFLLMTIAVHGEDGYLEFWERLKPNVLTITSGWSEGYGLYTEGEAPIVLSYETSPAYHIAYEDTDRYRNLIINEAGYAQIEVAGITNGAPNLVNARRLMDFLLTDAVQSEIPLSQFMYPAVDGVTLPEAFEQVERADETLYLPVDRVDASFEQWLADWQEVMQ
ncbi:MAG: thiamine ABC transporter substrate-binding protein [Spirochaetota bacterium]